LQKTAQRKRLVKIDIQKRPHEKQKISITNIKTIGCNIINTTGMKKTEKHLRLGTKKRITCGKWIFRRDGKKNKK